MIKICSLIKGFYLIVPLRATRYLLSFFYSDSAMLTPHAESDSVVECTLQNMTLRCHAHREVV